MFDFYSDSSFKGKTIVGEVTVEFRVRIEVIIIL